MIRQIIKIDEEKCTGCGLCATACHEGAIDIVDGRRSLSVNTTATVLETVSLHALSTQYTLSIARHLPTMKLPFSPQMAAKQAEASKTSPVFHGCPGTRSRVISHAGHNSGSNAASAAGTSDSLNANTSELMQCARTD